MFLEEVELVEAARRGAEVAVVQALPHLQLSLVLRMHVVIYQFVEGEPSHTHKFLQSWARQFFSIAKKQQILLGLL